MCACYTRVLVCSHIEIGTDWVCVHYYLKLSDLYHWALKPVRF